MRTVYASIATYRQERDLWMNAYYELQEKDLEYTKLMKQSLKDLENKLDSERNAWRTELRKAKGPGWGVFAGVGLTTSSQVEGTIGIGYVWKIF
jgi:hypothetical protein